MTALTSKEAKLASRRPQPRAETTTLVLAPCLPCNVLFITYLSSSRPDLLAANFHNCITPLAMLQSLSPRQDSFAH